MLPLVAGLLGAGLGSAASGLFGLAGSGINYAQNVRLQKMQNDFNLDMWNRNNEYNSPQAQMQRFKEAGLNPNLIYSQGSAGLSSSPPVQNAPQGVDWSKPMQKLGEAFNIENLKTIVANRKKTEEEAKQAKLKTYEFEDEREAKKDFSLLYQFNPSTGLYEYNHGVESVSNNNPRGHDYGFKAFTRGWHFNKYLTDNYYRGALIPYRKALYDWQKNYLVPQVQMLNFERGKQPITYWVNTVGKGLHSLSEGVGIFSPKNWFVPRTSFNPYSNNY